MITALLQGWQMNKKINLSEKTQQLIQQYLMMVGENTDNFSSLSSTVDQEWLVNFLQEEPPISLINKKETRQANTLVYNIKESTPGLI